MFAGNIRLLSYKNIWFFISLYRGSVCVGERGSIWNGARRLRYDGR